MKIRPPLEEFAVAYFQGMGWWKPEEPEQSEELKPTQFSNPDLPEFEE